MAVKKIKRKPKKLRSSSYLSQLLGLIAIVLLSTIAVNQHRASAKEAKPQIVVAEHDLITLPAPQRTVKAGEKLSTVQFTTIELPKTTATQQYVSSIESYQNGYAKTSLPKLLPIPVDAISFEAIENNMVVEGIPDGMRAITVTVDAESAVEGWARSGSYVDVILIKTALSNNSELESKVIAENVRILSAGQSTTPTGTRTTAVKAPATVTLLTSQEEALKIKTASGLGKLTFALRGIGDESPSQVVAMNQRHLLGESSSNKSPRYTGFAKDSEGRVFVLTQDKQWIRSKEQHSSSNRVNAGDGRARLAHELSTPEPE